MGRKGNSKRKPKQANAKGASSDKAGGSVSAVMQAVDSQSTKTFETSKSAGKPAADRKNKSK
jgi:hypothetical protein